MKKGVIAVLSSIAGVVAGAVVTGSIQGKSIEKKAEKVDKFKSYYNMLNQWLMLRQEGKTLEKYFLDNNYKTIAIYGMGEMGNRLYDELKDTQIQVKYGVDKKADNTYSEIDVVEMDKDMETVDAVVVTAVFAFEEIENELQERVDWPVISLEDVVYEV